MGKQIHWVNQAKAIGIILVVIGHSGAPGILTKLIYSFHMPLFFILSGYLFDSTKWHGVGIRKFAVSRFRTLILVYLIWGLINLILNVPVEYISQHQSFNEAISSILNHLRWMLISYGGRHEFPNCTPLWFLPCLYFSSIYLFFLTKVRNTSLITLLLFSMFSCQQNTGRNRLDIPVAH